MARREDNRRITVAANAKKKKTNSQIVKKAVLVSVRVKPVKYLKLSARPLKKLRRQ